MHNKIILQILCGLVIVSFTPFAFAELDIQDFLNHDEDEDEEEDLGGEGYGENALLLEVEILNLSLFGIFVALIIHFIRKKQFHKTNPSWIYFLFAIILYGMTRIFYITADRGILFVSDDTLELLWHFIFFNSLILLLFSIKNIMAKPGFVEPKSLKFCLTVCIISLVFSSCMFIFHAPLDTFLNVVFSDTFLAGMGIQHLIAFTFASIVAFSLIEIRSFPEKYEQFYFIPLVIIFVLFVTYHVWEMITESLELIMLEEEVIEQVEQIIVIPIFVIFILGFIHMKKKLEVKN